MNDILFIAQFIAAKFRQSVFQAFSHASFSAYRNTKPTLRDGVFPKLQRFLSCGTVESETIISPNGCTGIT
jgi:hypothetical protein